MNQMFVLAAFSHWAFLFKPMVLYKSNTSMQHRYILFELFDQFWSRLIIIHPYFFMNKKRQLAEKSPQPPKTQAVQLEC